MKMCAVNWESCRRPDGSYILTIAARQTGCKITEQMYLYLSLVESIRPITSRQIVALSIATALALYQPDAAEEGAKE